jgi:polygalacturonase
LRGTHAQISAARSLIAGRAKWDSKPKAFFNIMHANYLGMYYVKLETRADVATGQGIHSSKVFNMGGGNVQCYEVNGRGRNSDGLNISNSTKFLLQNFHMSAEDDCVSIINTSKNITVRDGNCLGAVHGISLGSFNEYTEMMNIRVENILFDARGHPDRGDQLIHIKSYPSASGFVRNVVYSQLRVLGSFKTFVYFNQNYPHRTGVAPTNARMVYENILITGISGQAAIRNENVLNCGRGLCRNIQFSKWSVNGQTAPTFKGQNNADVRILQ